MLLTVSTTHQPATDLGYLLHKNPARIQTEQLTFGKAHVFYPDADENLCTVALLADMDPIGLPKTDAKTRLMATLRYEFAAYGWSLTYCWSCSPSAGGCGRSKDRPELADTAIPQ